MVPTGHVVIAFDPKRLRSKYMQNAHFDISIYKRLEKKREESLWTNKKPGDVRIFGALALIDELEDLLILVVREGYVRRAKEWPGLMIGPWDWGQEIAFEDPDYRTYMIDKKANFLDETGLLPVGCPGKRGQVNTRRTPLKS